ncbi:MAG: response regulator [Ignavibacteriales bacterium]|nr:response regulator [Ignavibacteriales bacterium]MBI3788076.1 response regulator [Ignavibacteriales bacterium]
MASHGHVFVLLIEDNIDFAKLVKLYLDKFEEAKIEVIWKNNGPDAIEEAVRNKDIDVILMDYFLPGMNGLEITRALQQKNLGTPVVFLTVNKDMNLAVEVMKLGVQDYLVKEEISTPILPKTIMSVVEQSKFQKEMALLEIRQKRLEAMQEMIVGITNEIGAPLQAMKNIVSKLLEREASEKSMKYLTIIKDNVNRIESKMEKLNNLKEDKTVQYIKDIKMIDLS